MRTSDPLAPQLQHAQLCYAMQPCLLQETLLVSKRTCCRPTSSARCQPSLRTSEGSFEMIALPTPRPLTSATVASSGSKPLGQAHTNSKGNLAANRIQECTILLPSPTYTTCTGAHRSAARSLDGQSRDQQRLGASPTAASKFLQALMR